MLSKITNAIRARILKFFDWVVANKGVNNIEAISSFSNGGGMVVRGFMRDYKLLSKIDPKHFVNGGSSNIIPMSISQYRAMQNSDINVTTSNFSNEEPADEVILGVDEDAGTALVAETRPNAMPVFTRISITQENGSKLEVDIEHRKGDPSPKSVFDELNTVPNPADMVDLERKISSYVRIYDVIRVDASRGNKETIQDVIQRLKNRKLYSETPKYKEFFDQFRYVTDEDINLFLDKYNHLKIGPADDFIPEMPVDAHEKLLAYTDNVMAMCQSKPVFYLIAKASDFKSLEGKRQKRDPILLAQSPLGMFWQIIGVWGEEDMLLVNDL